MKNNRRKMHDEKFELKELDDLEKKLGKKLDYVRFCFCNLNGMPKGVSIPRKQVPGALKNGFSYFAGIMTATPRTDLTFTKELIDLHLPNCSFLPMSHTLQHLPWAGKRRDAEKNDANQRLIGQVLCESFWIAPFKNGAHMEACPRYILKKQLDRLDKLGYVFKSAFEVEFTVYDQFDQFVNKPVFSGLDAGSMLVFSKFEDYLLTLEENLQQLGIETSYITVQGGEGQFKFALEPSDGIKSADALFNSKQVIKEISLQRGYQATFMSTPPPSSNELKRKSTNGLHLNVSLWKKYGDGTLQNSFHDAAEIHGMSLLHRYWIAGLIRHGKALSAICCPTFNCYRRLHKFMTPDKIDWGIDDKTTSFRVKSHIPSATYCENRIPSGGSNPYLVVAATIIAGLDGIINKLDLQPPRTDKIDPKDIDKVNEIFFDFDKKLDLRKDNYLPYSLSEALDELEKDDVMKEAFGEEFIRWFVQMKRDGEVIPEECSNQQKWNKERLAYFEFI